jgi:hypothetical protein
MPGSMYRRIPRGVPGGLGGQVRWGCQGGYGGEFSEVRWQGEHNLPGPTGRWCRRPRVRPSCMHSASCVVVCSFASTKEPFTQEPHDSTRMW